MIDSSTIKAAKLGKYTEFSKAIRAELAQRLLDHPVINEYNRQISYFNNIRDKYKGLPSLDNYRI